MRVQLAKHFSCLLCGVCMFSCTGCCIHYVRTVDVSNKSAIVYGYKVGQCYRLKRRMLLVAHDPGDDFNEKGTFLWSEERLAANRARMFERDKSDEVIAVIPEGSILTVDRTIYRTDEFIFEALCLMAPRRRIPEVLAQSTVDANSVRWKKVIAPVEVMMPIDHVGPAIDLQPDHQCVELVH